jgi:hypothetical protein
MVVGVAMFACGAFALSDGDSAAGALLMIGALGFLGSAIVERPVR